ncbi:hypothetical protein Tco_1367854 [Tanacetum coccineum]
MKCPQHYLTEMQEVILFYNGLDVPTRQTLDSKGAIPTKTAADAKHNSTILEEKPRRQSIEESLSKFMSESTKRHQENSNLIKEIRTSTDAAIRKQGASIKTLEIQIGEMSKKEYYGLQCLDASSYGATRVDDSLPQKEKDLGSFTLPCYINNICFDNALADLGASNLGEIKLMPTIEEGEVIDEPIIDIIKTRNNEVENMNGYRDQDMGDIIFGEPFCKASCVEARRIAVIMEYLVKISKKARILELERRNLKITDSDILYAVSIKEDMAYLCLHFTKDHEGIKFNTLYLEEIHTPYSI